MVEAAGTVGAAGVADATLLASGDMTAANAKTLTNHFHFVFMLLLNAKRQGSTTKGISIKT